MASRLKIPKIPVPRSRKYRTPVSLRAAKDELQYTKVKSSRVPKSLLDEARLKEWKLWALIENEFPYTSAFKTHHMLIPKRVVDDKNLSIEERLEMDKILQELGEIYDCVLINFKKKQSITHHFHMHLLIYKDNRKELKI